MQSPGMCVDDWVATLRDEYLNGFIRDGGAAVKFGVASDADVRGAVHDQLQRTALESSFAYALVEAESVRLHMIDKVFFEVARQTDWDRIVHSFVKGLFERNDYQLPSTNEEFTIRSIAQVNGIAEPALAKEFQKWLTNELFKVFELCQEFRLALMRLCQDHVSPQGQLSQTNEAIHQWLRGELRLLSAVKDAFIYQRIARHNARHMLFSLAYFLHLAGESGLVLTLDISRYAVPKRPPNDDPSLYYGPSVVLDAYEVLRQFIDATDELNYCLVVVVTAPEFLTDEKRGLTRYKALNLRLADEVRDADRINPLSSLMRLTA